LALRDADLETVLQFMQAKARRTRPFTVPDQTASGQRMDAPELFPTRSGIGRECRDRQTRAHDFGA